MFLSRPFTSTDPEPADEVVMFKAVPQDIRARYVVQPSPSGLDLVAAQKRVQEQLGQYTKSHVERIVYRPDEYRVYVDYAMPSFDELKKEFCLVSHIYDGRPFQKHALCIGMDETPGDRTLLLALPCSSFDLDKFIAHEGELGYRPATHLEAYAFQKAHPELLRKSLILAPGSFAQDDGGGCWISLLHVLFGKVLFEHHPFKEKPTRNYRLLFVRK